MHVEDTCPSRKRWLLLLLKLICFIAGINLHTVPSSIMSLSPTATTSNSSDAPSKRRRTDSITPINTSSQQGMTQLTAEGSVLPSSSQSSMHIPKRGARACTACRKGKNRCEGEVSSLDHPLYHRPATNSLVRLPRRPGIVSDRHPVVDVS